MAHAAKQEIKRCLFAFRTIFRLFFRREIIIDRLNELSRSLVTNRRVAGQRLVQNTGQTLVDRSTGRQPDILIGNAVHGLKNIAAFNRPPASQHFKQNQAGREDVCALANFTPLNVFGCHVGRRAGVFLHALARRINAGSNAEIHHPGHAFFIDQNIRRFQVTVNDTQRMSMGNGIKDGPQNGGRVTG